MKNTSEPKRSRGRPRREPAGLVERHMLSFPPSLWEEFERRVPAGERSPLICQLLTRELKRRRREEEREQKQGTGVEG